MKKFIVTTTINSPTRAIQAFDDMLDWHLVVVGDKKTPKPFQLNRGTYIEPEEQDRLYPELSQKIGWNCIQRRNIGFLFALSQGAEIVATVDDDNIPLENWGTNVLVGSQVPVKKFRGNNGVFDPIAVTNYSHLWHRGFPLQQLSTRKYELLGETEETFDIQADFWNGDPDIDAICRMEHKPNCTFEVECFPFASDSVSPFNSQNTFLSRNALKSYFMFPSVGRMDDIWAAYYLQAKGFKVYFQKASVIQERNAHDLTLDLEREIIGYLNNERLIVDIKSDPESLKKYVGEASWESFLLYREIAHSYA